MRTTENKCPKCKKTHTAMVTAKYTHGGAYRYMRFKCHDCAHRWSVTISVDELQKRAEPIPPPPWPPRKIVEWCRLILTHGCVPEGM